MLTETGILETNQIFDAAVRISKDYGFDTGKIAFVFAYNGRIIASRFPEGLESGLLWDLQISARRLNSGLLIASQEPKELNEVLYKTIEWASKEGLLGR